MNLNRKVRQFNLLEYLEDRGLEKWTEGKNVSRGWTNVQCPFPGCDDRSNHCGVSPQNVKVRCWKCGDHGDVINLIKEIDQSSFKEAVRVLSQFVGSDVPMKNPPKARKRQPTVGNVALPPLASRDFEKMHIRYLRNRRYQPKKLIKKYGLYACPEIGDYKYRIIIPFYLDRKMVTFTSLDVTGQANVKYLHLSIENSIIDPKRMVYNIDSVNGTALIVEGVTDVWRIGDGTVATMGTEYVEEQIELLLKKGVTKAFVLFDSDATGKGEKLANQLSGSIDHVELLELESGDPDELSKQEVLDLRQMVFG